MVSSPKISVLVPTYNYGRYLPELIDSVLAQDFRDFELLIVDDCSRDDTAQMVQPYCARDPRIQFSVNSSNLGMVRNWNQCLERARGKYVKFLFGDDKLFDRHALGELVGLLDRNPAATLAASARAILDEQSKVVDIYRTLPDGLHQGRQVITRCITQNAKNLVGEPSVVMFRKADASRGFNTSYRQIVDMEMWFHLLEKGDLAYTRRPLCAFRCHPCQQTEENTASGVGRREHVSFFTEYATLSLKSKEAVFSLLFHFRRWLRRNPGELEPELRACERKLVDFLGEGWHWPYRAHCARYRVTRPLQNLAHSVEKRLFAMRVRSATADSRMVPVSVRSSAS